jgi:mRNA interferase MazF
VPLRQGTVVWVWLDPVVGREQGGRRPALVVSGDDYLETVTELAMVMPVTSRSRGWRNHIAVAPPDLLGQPSWVMTEQVRTVSRSRIAQVAGQADRACVAQCLEWLADFTA